jgi:hypothetical protein
MRLGQTSCSAYLVRAASGINLAVEVVRSFAPAPSRRGKRPRKWRNNLEICEPGQGQDAFLRGNLLPFLRAWKGRSLSAFDLAALPPGPLFAGPCL